MSQFTAAIAKSKISLQLNAAKFLKDKSKEDNRFITDKSGSDLNFLLKYTPKTNLN